MIVLSRRKISNGRSSPLEPEKHITLRPQANESVVVQPRSPSSTLDNKTTGSRSTRSQLPQLSSPCPISGLRFHLLQPTLQRIFLLIPLHSSFLFCTPLNTRRRIKRSALLLNPYARLKIFATPTSILGCFSVYLTFFSQNTNLLTRSNVHVSYMRPNCASERRMDAAKMSSIWSSSSANSTPTLPLADGS